MLMSVELNRIFWSAAVECFHFAGGKERAPRALAGHRPLLFQLACRRAALLQKTGEADRDMLQQLRPLLPRELQSDSALARIDQLAAIAVKLRQEQGKATDTRADASSRADAQAAVDELLAQRAELSAAIDGMM